MDGFLALATEGQPHTVQYQRSFDELITDALEKAITRPPVRPLGLSEDVQDQPTVTRFSQTGMLFASQ